MSPGASRQRSWKDYLIPGTEVLRNKFTSPEAPYGVTEPNLLAALEHAVTQTRLIELRQNPLPGPLDYDHMKAIHRHIFQDVYEWAGEERTAPAGGMFKAGHRYFGAGPALTERAEQLYDQLAGKDELRGLDREQFIPELADIWGELNVVHSFREGNTRSQFAFFEQLCDRAGYTLHVERFKVGAPLREEFVDARFHNQDTGRIDRLTAVLQKGIEGGPSQRLTRTEDGGPTKPARPLRDQIATIATRMQQQADALPRTRQPHQDRERGPKR